jgi:hypothetical protein
MKRRLIVELSEDAFKKLQRMKEIQGFADRDWGEFLTFLSKDVHLTPTEGEIISEATRLNLFELWMQNFAENLPYIRNGETIEKLVPPEPDKPPKGACIVVGAGPSIYKYKHLDMLAESGFKGKILACDSMLIKCLEKGIIPDYTISVDGAEIIAKFYDHELVRKHGENIKVLLISTVHPKVRQLLEEAKAQIYWYHGLFDDYRSPESFTKLISVITKSQKNPKGLPSVSCLGNSGAASWVIAHSLLRCSPIALIGLDLSYPEGYPLEKTYYFSTYLKAAGGDVSKALAFGYREIYNPYWKNKCVCDPVFYHYREGFLEAAQYTERWVITCNATGGGALFGKNIYCINFEDFLKYYQDIEELKKHFLKGD